MVKNYRCALFMVSIVLHTFTYGNLGAAACLGTHQLQKAEKNIGDRTKRDCFALVLMQSVKPKHYRVL
jgi:hypothetical protein